MSPPTSPCLCLGYNHWVHPVYVYLEDPIHGWYTEVVYEIYTPCSPITYKLPFAKDVTKYQEDLPAKVAADLANYGVQRPAPYPPTAYRQQYSRDYHHPPTTYSYYGHPVNYPTYQPPFAPPYSGYRQQAPVYQQTIRNTVAAPPYKTSFGSPRELDPSIRSYQEGYLDQFEKRGRSRRRHSSPPQSPLYDKVSTERLLLEWKDEVPGFPREEETQYAARSADFKSHKHPRTKHQYEKVYNTTEDDSDRERKEKFESIERWKKESEGAAGEVVRGRSVEETRRVQRKVRERHI